MSGLLFIMNVPPCFVVLNEYLPLLISIYRLLSEHTGIASGLLSAGIGRSGAV